MTEKYVLVTGGAQNIGKAISKRLTEDGFQIIILDIKDPSHEYFTVFNKVDLSDALSVQSCLV